MAEDLPTTVWRHERPPRRSSWSGRRCVPRWRAASRKRAWCGCGKPKETNQPLG